MVKLTDILSKAKTFFIGTAEELKQYKNDLVMKALFLGEIAATAWSLHDLGEVDISLIGLPFAVDFLSRGAYSIGHYFSDRRRLRNNLSNNLTEEQASNPEVKYTLNRIADKEAEGLFPPGLIGIIRQGGRYQPMIDTYDD